jgi:hypothetical protein
MFSECFLNAGDREVSKRHERGGSVSSLHQQATVLLTSDNALAIKALAEGLEVAEAAPFYKSFVSPYGERYIYGVQR